MQITVKSTIQKPTIKTQEKIPNTIHHIGNAATRTATTSKIQIEHLRGCDDMGINRDTDQVQDDIQTLGKYPIMVRVTVMVRVRVQLPMEQTNELRTIFN